MRPRLRRGTRTTLALLQGILCIVGITSCTARRPPAHIASSSARDAEARQPVTRDAPRKPGGDTPAPKAGADSACAFRAATARKPFDGRWPWRVVDARDRLVDDPRSPHYNTWQRQPRNRVPPWRSAEELSAYALGIIVRHNMDPVVPGAGSAIFIHDGDPLSPTSGCTTMEERELLQLLSWLDPRAAPVLLQLPSPALP